MEYRVRFRRDGRPVILPCKDKEQAHIVADALNTQEAEPLKEPAVVEYQSTEWFVDKEYEIAS